MEISTTNKQGPNLNLDINAQRNFAKFFEKLGEKPATTVRFFDRVDFYSVHGADDCELVSKIVYKSTAYVRQMLPDEPRSLAYLTLSKVNFETAVREVLLVRNLRAEVYVRQTMGDWSVKYRGSPGNLIQFEELLFSNRDVLVGNRLLSVQLRAETGAGGQHRRLGIASVEQNDCQFQVLEFIDDDFLTELEATVVLLGPRECLLPQSDGEYAPVKELLERNGAIVTIVKRSPAGGADLVEELNKLLHFAPGQQRDANALPEMQLTLAMAALRAALKYLRLTEDAGNSKLYQLQQLDLKRFVHLDAAAVAALNILPRPGIVASSSAYRWQSLLGVLDHCRTPQGHRLLAQWLKQPLRSRAILNDRHDIVQCLLEAPDTLQNLHDNLLKRIPDILMLTKKLWRRRASLVDLFRIYQMLLRTPKIVRALETLENSTVQSVICDPLRAALEDLCKLKQMVEQVIDFEAIESGEYLVKGTFDSQLENLKSRMSRLHAKMVRLQAAANEELNLERGQSVRLENIGHLGYHFRITLKDDSALRKNKNYKIVDIVKGGVRFSSTEMTEISEEFSLLRERYEEQQKSIVEEVIQVAIGYATPLTSLNNELAQTDCLVSFAIAAQAAPIPYVRPKLLEEGAGILCLKDIRHPCLELQEHVSFIANDVTFRRDDCELFVITGPNMGGKSTYIRSVGATVLMAHCGAFVPCTEATISMVDCILGRVGASDNILKGLSTFMVEMIETSAIVRTATDKSLVIIDELGRGTSTYEGCGIAWSIAEYLARETRCFTLFATHFHEITELATTVATVRNCHMAAIADEDRFTLMYQVRPGVMEKSFGIQVARLAHFPEHVVQHAQKIYGEFEDEHREKQTAQDRELLAKIGAEVTKLSNDEEALQRLVESFGQEIKALDSAYFRAVLADES